MLFLKNIFTVILLAIILTACDTGIKTKNHNEIIEQLGVKQINTHGKGIISGQVISKSDIMTRSDSPYSRGLVLAISSNSMKSLLDSAGVVLDERKLQFARFKINRELFSTYDIASVALESKEGRYSFNLNPGNYNLCIANLMSSAPKNFPIHVFGCVEISIEPGTRHYLNIFFGEGGVVGL